MFQTFIFALGVVLSADDKELNEISKDMTSVKNRFKGKLLYIASFYFFMLRNLFDVN